MNANEIETPAALRAAYGLTHANGAHAIEQGLAEADWYQCPIPRSEMRRLLERRDGPGVRDTLLWFALILSAGVATYLLWPSPWGIVGYAVYAVLYASTCDARWHEAGHGTAFKTDWMNNALYEIASFMVMREATVWRWSHTRHHSDTIIVGRDPEIAVPRPPNIRTMILGFFGVPVYRKYFPDVVRHAFGQMNDEERSYVPASEFPKVFWRARIYLGIYVATLVLSLVTHSILPLLYIGLANLFGSWLMPIYGLTQHAGLAENVLDHRLNCRTVYMNRVNRFLYMNMGFHLEHHMFPLVPYHALPRLHATIKDDCPTPYPGLIAAWREIVPAVLRQRKDPAYHVKRRLPERKPAEAAKKVSESPPAPDAEGWIEVCAAADLSRADVMRFDYGTKTYALYRTEDGALYATDGICTHGNTHLSDGLVIGKMIECPKHNGRFHLPDGSPARAPICRGLVTYPLTEIGGRLRLNVARPNGTGLRPQRELRFRVVSNQNVATFIKELVLEPVEGQGPFEFTPGDYLQFEIPTFSSIAFKDFDIAEPYREVWVRQHLFDLVATNADPGVRNNYSIGSNQRLDHRLRFNIRIATPPPGQNCPPGRGSSYMFSLQPGAEVKAIGPFGEFHIKPTQREMVYIGGGAGMAPLRAHLTHLFETETTARKVSFWYGARSKQEIFYDDYFAMLAETHRNFSFHVALSSPLPEDGWTGAQGFIHEVVSESYLRNHPRPKEVEYYLCGPPMMIKACLRTLEELGVPRAHIAYDEF